MAAVAVVITGEFTEAELVKLAAAIRMIERRHPERVTR
jgi:hypothetical protein